MLALRAEQVRRGVGEVVLQNEAPTAKQGRPPLRIPSHKQVINIKEKISQWEGRSQQSSGHDTGVKVHPLTVSRTLSGDLLGNGCPNESWRGGLHAKADISKRNNSEFDFQESPAQAGHSVGGRKSEPVHSGSSELLATSPGNKTFSTQILASPKVEATDKRIITANGDQKIGRILDAEVVSKPLPLSTDDPEDNMPAGNFYTSRGFWRKLEGNRLLWEKGRGSSGEANPPPKPQRTFQYRGTKNSNNTEYMVQWDRGSSHNNHSNTRTRRVAQPPNFPPPPCPVGKSEGLSRHKKNRSVSAQKKSINNHRVLVKSKVEWNCCSTFFDINYSRKVY